MPWEAITQAATALAATAGAIVAIVKAGQQLGIWRRVRQWWQRRQRRQRRFPRQP
jgi:hypothetical protein